MNFNGNNGNFGGYNSGSQNFGNVNNIDIEACIRAVKKASKQIMLGILIIIGLAIVGECFYVVEETDHIIKTRFNKIIEVNTNNLSDENLNKMIESPVYNDVKITNGAGLKFKFPFVDKVETYDNRLITYDTAEREVITLDQKKIILDNNAQWRITDPYKFKLTMGSITAANRRIEDLMYSKINEKVGKTYASDLISNKEYIESMLLDIDQELNVIVEEFGITIADVRIKRTDLPEENSENIYNRMRTERQQIATQYRSEGREEATKIMAQADMEARVLVAEAYAEAEQIKGEGEAEAASIYNDAYNQDPEFFEFYMSLQTYQKSLGSNSTIVISPDSQFAKYIYSSNVQAPSQVPAVAG